MVTVVHAPEGAQAFLAKYRTQIALSAVGLAGGVLLIILLSGRLRIKSAARTTTKRANAALTRSHSQCRSNRQSLKSGSRPHVCPGCEQDRLQDAPAYLTRLGPDGEPVTGQPIPLTEKVTTFGTDPVQAVHVLDHPSIAALHARLKQTESGEFLLVDNDTVAGTWVNYDPVPKDGRIMKHGDVVHFGQLMYRFALKNTPG